ncbi:MAG TPA: hypothetical protein VGD79_06945 [Thermoanaerobaculia bacterium]|jgi:hypothetical protein
MTDDLRAIVDEAYAVFSAYEIGGRLTVCNCNVCMHLDTERLLASTPLRELPSSLLAEYTNSAHGYDDGDIARELRYFLPRYFELIANGDPPDHMGMLDLCLSRLGEASYRTHWSLQEADVIDRFFDAFLIACTSDLEMVEWPVGWKPAFRIIDALTLALTAGADVERLIAALERAPDPGAGVHLASLRDHVEPSGTVHVLGSAYLETERFRDTRTRLGAWLISVPVRARIEAAFYAVEDPRVQEFLSKSAW